jgi:hypothetical protein
LGALELTCYPCRTGWKFSPETIGEAHMSRTSSRPFAPTDTVTAGAGDWHADCPVGAPPRTALARRISEMIGTLLAVFEVEPAELRQQPPRRQGRGW